MFNTSSISPIFFAFITKNSFFEYSCLNVEFFEPTIHPKVLLISICCELFIIKIIEYFVPFQKRNHK